MGWPQSSPPAPEMYRALAYISSDSLRGDVSFLASKALEGRDTPSRGLDVAAEYIASRFRGAGLEPAGDDGYFQTARMWRTRPAAEGFDLRISDGSRTVTVGSAQASVVSRQPLSLSGAAVYKIADAAQLKSQTVKNRVIELDDRRDCAALGKAAAALQPAAFLETEDERGHPLADHLLIDPDEERAVYGDIPRIIVRQTEAVKLLRDAKDGESGVALSIRLPAATPLVTARNVAGLWRGSDPALCTQYILLTAHYDHLGQSPGGEVYAGANDDASGTASVIEIARAMAAMPVHPKRSVVFMTFFGEEEGSLGSQYYVRHPLVPLAETVADLNLEQVGRTDSNRGPEVSNATITGFQYSSVPRTLQEAGKATGVKVYDTPGGDAYFSRSDNLTFAERGIPAHTVAVTLEFPDYHDTGDTWQKIDYGNMAKVDRMIALGLAMLADNPAAPHWNTSNPNVAPFVNGK